MCVWLELWSWFCLLLWGLLFCCYWCDIGLLLEFCEFVCCDWWIVMVVFLVCLMLWCMVIVGVVLLG